MGGWHKDDPAQDARGFQVDHCELGQYLVRHEHGMSGGGRLTEALRQLAVCPDGPDIGPVDRQLGRLGKGEHLVRSRQAGKVALGDRYFLRPEPCQSAHARRANVAREGPRLW